MILLFLIVVDTILISIGVAVEQKTSPYIQYIVPHHIKAHETAQQHTKTQYTYQVDRHKHRHIHTVQHSTITCRVRHEGSKGKYRLKNSLCG